MSCDIAAAAFLFLAAAGGTPAAAVAQASVVSVAREPLYADIVARASGLKSQVEGYRRSGSVTGMDAFTEALAQLAELDMKGHLDLAARGVDGDLKCILRGISQDLAKRVAELKAAKAWNDQDPILRDMAYLLDDNVAVITAPPAPPV